MGAANSLYQRVTDITEDYLGPAAPRFLNRISLNHLDKPATRIVRSDIPELITWVRLAASVMTDDPVSVDQYVARLRSLADTTQASKKRPGNGASTSGLTA